MKETFEKYNITEEIKWSMDQNDFDRLVQDHLPKLTNQDKYKNFESIAEFEWNNYSNYDAEVTKDALKEDSIYYKFDKQDIINGKSFISLDSIICFLIEHKILQFGKYEVIVFW